MDHTHVDILSRPIFPGSYVLYAAVEMYSPVLRFGRVASIRLNPNHWGPPTPGVSMRLFGNKSNTQTTELTRMVVIPEADVPPLVREELSAVRIRA